MYAIYEQQGGKLDLFEEEEEFVDLNEAEEILRLLRSQDPGEFQRIAALRDGIRAGKGANHSGTYVFCQAGQYQQLFLLDGNGEIISRDIPRILGTVKCGREEPGNPLRPGHNKTVMTVKRVFAEEVKHREAERKHTLSLTLGQRYVLRELRIHFGAINDEETKGQINLMEQVFRGSMMGCSRLRIRGSQGKRAAEKPKAAQLGFQEGGSFPEMGGTQPLSHGKESSWSSRVLAHGSYRQVQLPPWSTCSTTSKSA